MLVSLFVSLCLSSFFTHIGLGGGGGGDCMTNSKTCRAFQSTRTEMENQESNDIAVTLMGNHIL